MSERRMTPRRLISVAKMYEAKLAERGITAARRGKPLEHAAYMCSKIQEYALDDLRDKALKRLGFVQAILWMEKIYEIEELKAHNHDGISDN